MPDPTPTWSRATSAQLARRFQGQEYLDGSSATGTSQSPYGTHNYVSLRSTASRFSLNEQFAATRREYEFGYDDASSIWERGTVMSRQPDETDVAGVPFTSPGEVESLDPVATFPPLWGSDFYDILCVSRDSPGEEIRRAYHRLFSLLDPAAQPPSLRQVAEDYFVVIQMAFETLHNPCQRAIYDLDCYDLGLPNVGVAKAQESNRWNPQMATYLASTGGESGIWELGASFDVQQAIGHGKYDPKRGGKGLNMVDLEMNHAVSIEMTELDWRICGVVQRLQHRSANSYATTDMRVKKHPTTNRVGGTVLTLRSSIYGLLQDHAHVLSLFDRQQLSFPHVINQERFSWLRNGLIRPLVGVNLQHIIPNSYVGYSRTDAVQTSAFENDLAQAETVMEVETTILPEPTATVRLSKPIVLPFDQYRSSVRLEMEQSLLKRRLPRLATTLERPTTRGQLLLHINSGDWGSRPDDTCRYFADFTRINRRSLSIGDLGDGLLDGLSGHITPRVEIAFRTRGAFKSQESSITLRPRNQGIRALDATLDNDEEGSWTVTASAEPGYCLASAKYARDIDFSALPFHQPGPGSSNNRSSASAAAKSSIRGRLRVETEMGTSSFGAVYLAFRCLRRVGRLSKLGFEIGLGRYSLYLSLYWSRLGQRISIPFYLCPRSNVNIKTFLLTTLIPFAGFALWELWDQRRRRKQQQQLLDIMRGAQYTQKRRAEADALTSLMAPAVQSRQKLESSESGLVILSAKYGVKARGVSDAAAWGAAEVADVTIPVAALVDCGRLVIPSGVRKSFVLGFWDPDPAEEKVLHIRYSYQGKEDIVEMRGDEEQLVLPPLSLQ